MPKTTISLPISKLVLFRMMLCIGIGLCLALGLFLRIEDLIAWQEQPREAYYKNTPLLTTFDGYYYARFARDLVEGAYNSVDELRAIPQNAPRPMPPPFLSLLIAAVVKVSGASIDWVSTFFPPAFAILLFLPMFLLGRLWGSNLTGLVAGLIALCSPYYVNRSRLGWLDTDCGNVTFTMLAIYLAIQSLNSQGRKQIWWVAGFLLNFLVFVLWWDTTPYVVVAICLGGLVLSWLCETGSLRRNLVPVSCVVGFIVVFMVVLKDLSFWTSLVSHLWGHLQYISKASPGAFPNIGLSISEQVRIPLEGIVQISSGSWFVFVPAVLGLILLFVRSPRTVLQLLIPMVLGALAILYAKRFAIFLAPLVGLGIGFLLHWLRDQAKLRTPSYPWKGALVGACLALPLGLGILILTNLASTYWPVEPPALIQGMDLAGEKTSPGSVIWAWWDHGYPMQYWSRRATISDGSYHDGEVAMINAFALASSDYQQAANWMQFYVTRGRSGFQRVYQALGGTTPGLAFIRKVLAAGPEKAAGLIEAQGLTPKDQWLAFFFPPPQEQRPVFLFLDERLIGTAYWWYWFGSWDVAGQEGEHPVYDTFREVKREGNSITGSPRFSIDLDRGVFSAQKMQVPLSKVMYRDGNQWQVANYRDVGMVFQYEPASGWGVLCSPEIHESVFNRLFFMAMADIRYFKPVLLKTGIFQIWEVLSESPAQTDRPASP
jgi:asparagine N-glycosylation enzyme membrane subunit Stt3